MTKENLEEMTKIQPRNKEERLFQEAIRSFLIKYICIPKGTNRHKYADVWHNFAEGIIIQGREIGTTDWIDIPLKEYDNYEYQTKLSDVYEWKWKINEIVIDSVTEKYYTEDEISKINGFTFTKQEQTKRIRE